MTLRYYSVWTYLKANIPYKLHLTISQPGNQWKLTLNHDKCATFRISLAQPCKNTTNYVINN